LVNHSGGTSSTPSRLPQTSSPAWSSTMI
jgi:hypothetical protein